jgi:O-antigen ligase
MAWIFTVRSVAVLNMLYFVACYAFNSLQRIKTMMSWIVFLTSFAMLYGFKQEFLVFTAPEKQWLYADKERFQLFFQWGRMRIFSILSDPMTYGIMMSYMGLFCIIMATAPLQLWKRILSAIVGVMMLWVTAYTGTRTCYVLIPIGFAFYAVMTLTPRVLGAIGVCILLGLGLVFKSSSNPVIYRIQSAFKPSNDASVQLRYYNQQRIRPHIYSHPIGFGLGSTGLWAQRFTPDSWLAKFAHDSYYVRLAVETGWIGLSIYMIFIYTVMRRAIYFYNRVRDPIIKTLYLALSTALFMLVVANYPQEAIVQLPTSMMVYVFFAAIVRLKDFDEAFAPLSK